jgi:hypothetical protein
MNLIPSDLIASKDLQKDIAQRIIDSVSEGEQSAIQVAAKIKFITDSLDEASKGIKGLVIQEAQKYDRNEAVTVLGGYSVEVKEMGVKYDYSNCNHPRLNEIDQEIAKLSEEKKSIEATLKSLKSSMTLVDEGTGEVITVYPPLKKSTTTPVFTFKK